MPDKELDRRMPFGIDEQGIRQLDAILARAGSEIADHIRRSESAQLEERIEELTQRYANPKDREPYVAHAQEWAESRIRDETHRCTSIEYVIDCSDRTRNHKLDLESLINFPNYDHAAICKLKVEIGNRDRSVDMTLTTNARDFNNVDLMITGDRTFLNSYGTEIEQWLRSIRRKYYWAYDNGMALAFITSFSVLGFLSLYVAMTDLTFDGKPDFGKSMLVAGLFSLFASIFLMPVLIWVGRCLFPIGEFVIGRGKDRRKRRDTLVYTVIGITVILGLVITIFGNFVSSWLTGHAPTR